MRSLEPRRTRCTLLTMRVRLAPFSAILAILAGCAAISSLEADSSEVDSPDSGGSEWPIAAAWQPPGPAASAEIDLVPPLLLLALVIVSAAFAFRRR